MGIFKDYLNRSNNNYVTEEGIYICRLEKIVRKSGLEDDTIIFVFKTDKKIVNNKLKEINLQDIILKFNFYNKNENAINFFVKVLLKIMNALSGNITKSEKECLSIIEKVKDIDELKSEIENLNKKYNKYVEINIEKKEYKGKVIYAPDYTKDFIRFYGDIEVENNNIDEFDDLPF